MTAFEMRRDSIRRGDRKELRTRGPNERMIAYACGFRDYTHFARKLRDRFGQAPGCFKAT
jgi:AraC family transcriptional regulator, positive regulator of tynA and feaB